MLGRLVRAIEDDLRARLAAYFAAHDALAAALSSAHVEIAAPILERAGALHDAEISAVLVRRVEEHRFWTARRPEPGDDGLNALVADADEEIAAEAMALVVARSRRFDRFQEPVLGRADLPAELYHKLVWLIAAALRHYVVQQHRLSAVDAATEEAASDLIASHDEGEGLEAAAARLASLLHRAGRLDGAGLTRTLEDGLLPFFVAGLATSTGLDAAATWEILSDPRARGPALLLRAAGLERADAARIFFALNAKGPIFAGQEGEATVEQLDLFDTLDQQSAAEVLRLWRADPAYRAGVARLSTRARSPAQAA